MGSSKFRESEVVYPSFFEGDPKDDDDRKINGALSVYRSNVQYPKLRGILGLFKLYADEDFINKEKIGRALEGTKYTKIVDIMELCGLVVMKKHKLGREGFEVLGQDALDDNKVSQMVQPALQSGKIDDQDELVEVMEGDKDHKLCIFLELFDLMTLVEISNAVGPRRRLQYKLTGAGLGAFRYVNENRRSKFSRWLKAKSSIFIWLFIMLLVLLYIYLVRYDCLKIAPENRKFLIFWEYLEISGHCSKYWSYFVFTTIPLTLLVLFAIIVMKLKRWLLQ